MTPGPLRRYVLLNDSLSLVCGTGLDSNPQASVTWMAPDGTTIMDNARYDLENGPLFVRLNFTHTIPSDSGIWKCRILVESEQDVVIDGQLVRQDLSPIGQTMIDIELVVIGKFHARNMDTRCYSVFKKLKKKNYKRVKMELRSINLHV